MKIIQLDLFMQSVSANLYDNPNKGFPVNMVDG